MAGEELVEPIARDLICQFGQQLRLLSPEIGNIFVVKAPMCLYVELKFLSFPGDQESRNIFPPGETDLEIHIRIRACHVGHNQSR